MDSAREIAKAANTRRKTPENIRLNLEQSKNDIEETYNLVNGEALRQIIKEFQSAHISSHHGQGWKLVDVSVGEEQP